MGPDITLTDLIIGIKGAGEMGSAIAWQLHSSGMHNIFMMEAPSPLAVRREVSFCEALHEGSKTVEGIQAVKAETTDEVRRAWKLGSIAVLVDTQWKCVKQIGPDVVIDAILAKKNLGTRVDEAKLVIGLGPGFVAGRDVHFVIETNRGHNLGRIITAGPAEPNTGIPGEIGGKTMERLLRAPADGEFRALRKIGDLVEQGDVVGRVGDTEIASRTGGVVRGLIKSGTQVRKGLKLGDIDPRNNVAACYTISDKARTISGSVLEAILRTFNR